MPSVVGEKARRSLDDVAQMVANTEGRTVQDRQRHENIISTKPASPVGTGPRTKYARVYTRGLTVATIEFDKVSKVFDDGTQAVFDLDLAIADAELMVMVGPSGCGKTTALRMVAGLEEVTDGELRIDDQVVNDLTPKERDIAMVFQNYALYPHMTVEQNLAFGLKLRKLPKEEITSGSRTPRRPSRSRSSWSGSRGRSPAASASGWRWGARSSASRTRS